MFSKHQDVSNKEKIRVEEILDENSNGEHRINIFYNEKLVGHSLYRDREDGDLDLIWIEVTEQFQRHGLASKCLDYFCQKAVDESKVLIINVVDEEVLDNFYFKWFYKHVNSTAEDDYHDDVIDYFNSLVSSQGDKYFTYNHPTLILKPDDINWKPNEHAPSFLK